MDIIVRLRLALWLMVLALWGSIVYQFLGEDVRPEMQWVSNPFPKRPAGSGKTRPLEPEPETTPTSIARLPAPWDGGDQKLAGAPPPGAFIQPITPKAGKPTSPAARWPKIPEKILRRHEYEPVEEPETPSGFVKSETQHFYVFSEGSSPGEEFLTTLESLHSNLMLDLAAFSPWARKEKVSVFLFRSQNSYRRVTGRPAWSGGASSVAKRKIYLYESEEVFGILAHELCHIYFDGFFLAGQPNPLWLSEGMATLVQVERGLTSPNWLPENLNILYRGGGFQLTELIRVDNTAGANDDNVRLWYTQAYSVVRFLIRSKWRSSFYNFCKNIRDGVPVNEALFRAYGMPFNRVKALEYAWRYDLETRRISNLRSRP